MKFLFCLERTQITNVIFVKGTFKSLSFFEQSPLPQKMGSETESKKIFKSFNLNSEKNRLELRRELRWQHSNRNYKSNIHKCKK